MQTATTESTKVIPAALFDELKKRADAAGGVGFGSGYSQRGTVCIGDFARAIDADNSTGPRYDWNSGETYAYGKSHQALITALGELFGDLNDRAVTNINERNGFPGYGYAREQPRVTFDELVAELGLVRGEA